MSNHKQPTLDEMFDHHQRLVDERDKCLAVIRMLTKELEQKDAIIKLLKELNGNSR